MTATPFFVIKLSNIVTWHLISQDIIKTLRLEVSVTLSSIGNIL